MIALTGFAMVGSPAQAAFAPAPAVSESFMSATGAGCLSHFTGHHGFHGPLVLDCDFGAPEIWTAASPITDKAGNPTSSWLVSDTGACLAELSGAIQLAQCGTVTLPNGVQAPDFTLYWRLQALTNGQVALVNVKSGHAIAANAPSLTPVDLSTAGTSAAWTVIPAGAA